MPFTLGSEVDDQVARGDNCPVPGRRYSGIGIAVECIGVQRAIVSNFGTYFNLWREPMLPGQRGVNVVGYNTGPLPLRIHEKFGTQGEVVQFVWRVTDIQQQRLLIGSAGQRRRVAAVCRVGRVERHDLWAERRSTTSDRS